MKRVSLTLSPEELRLLDACRGGRPRAAWLMMAAREKIDAITVSLCPRCEGDGEEWDGESGMLPCPVCGGTGRVRKIGGKLEKL